MTGTIIIPKWAENALFWGAERSPIHRLIFIHFSLPGAGQAVYQCPMIKNYIGYYRVSTDKQEYGMSSQREIVRRFAEGLTGK